MVVQSRGQQLSEACVKRILIPAVSICSCQTCIYIQLHEGQSFFFILSFVNKVLQNWVQGKLWEGTSPNLILVAGVWGLVNLLFLSSFFCCWFWFFNWHSFNQHALSWRILTQALDWLVWVFWVGVYFLFWIYRLTFFCITVECPKYVENPTLLGMVPFQCCVHWNWVIWFG